MDRPILVGESETTGITQDDQVDTEVGTIKIKHNEGFYLDMDPMATFQVENQLFRVHRHFLIDPEEGSQVFRDMFSCPTEDSKDGTSDEQPIFLPDVTVAEFEALMTYFYLPRRKQIMTAVETYLNLLRISHRFLFDTIFEYAREQSTRLIDNIPVKERIRAGDRYNLTEWLTSGYESLMICSSNAIGMEEVEILGLERMLKLMKAREDFNRNRYYQDSTDNKSLVRKYFS